MAEWRGGADTLLGGAGADRLDGGSGADNMAGGAGNDDYIVDNSGDTVTENFGEGQDTVYSSATFTLSANIENLNLTGTGNIDGAGNALDNIINGNIGDNTLVGDAGNDILNGNGGTDTLTGGTGDDAYFVGDAGSTLSRIPTKAQIKSTARSTTRSPTMWKSSSWRDAATRMARERARQHHHRQ